MTATDWRDWRDWRDMVDIDGHDDVVVTLTFVFLTHVRDFFIRLRYSMASTGINYDLNKVSLDIAQSTAPLNYVLAPYYAERCQQCNPSVPGWIGRQGVGYDSSRLMIDTESDLNGITRKLSRDPQKLYHPTAPVNQSNFPTCDNTSTQHTHLSNPAMNLKGTGINRFQPICLNPQDQTRWLLQTHANLNTQLQARDLYCPLK